MKSSAKKIELASVDDLFSTEESRADAQRERVLEIPLSELHPFKNHPFKVKDDEAMLETADSIKQYGVLVPAIARPDPEGGYGGETSQLLLGAALRFWNFSFVPLWGISQGFQPAAGTNYGAKDYDRVKTLTRVFITAATLLSLVFYIPAELFPEKILSMFLTTPGIAASGATNFRIMFSTYVLQGSFMIAVTLFQSLGKAKKATWLVLFRQIILFIPLCVVLPMIGGMGIRGVWLAIALTDAILVVITVSMMLYEFGKLPETSSVNR